MPRFVILRHATPSDYPRPLHWDLMFEDGPSLRTWALRAEPAPGLPIPAEHLADHRLAYLEFEGAIEGNRGIVTRWDAGIYETRSERDGEWIVLMQGRRVKGRLSLLLDAATAQWSVTWIEEPSGDAAAHGGGPV